MRFCGRCIGDHNTALTTLENPANALPPYTAERCRHIALAKAIGAQLGLQVRFKDYAFDGLLNAVQLGDVDAGIAAVSVTPDRQQIVDFSNLYYIGQPAVWRATP